MLLVPRSTAHLGTEDEINQRVSTVYVDIQTHLVIYRRLRSIKELQCVVTLSLVSMKHYISYVNTVSTHL